MLRGADEGDKAILKERRKYRNEKENYSHNTDGCPGTGSGYTDGSSTGDGS